MSCCFGVRRNRKKLSEAPKQDTIPPAQSKVEIKGAEEDDNQSRGSRRSRKQRLSQKKQSKLQPDKVQDPAPVENNERQLRESGRSRKQRLSQRRQSKIQNEQPQQNPKNQKQKSQIEGLKQIKIDKEEVRISQKERDKDYANQTGEVNAVTLKQDPKKMKQIRDLFGPNSIIQTPMINTFRYDCILAHAMISSQEQNN